ncbi:MAG: FdhF/YdeP family oxidoreductase [Pirellulales bacterium]
MKRLTSGGGWPAIWYVLKKAQAAGGILPMYRALRSRNTCKTCALGMGGQRGGMVNEAGSFPEVCKKSLQAMAGDMQPAIPTEFWSRHPVSHLRAMSPLQLEYSGRLVEPVWHEASQTHFQPISWDQALDRLTDQLRSTPADRSFWYSSGRSSNEAAFLLQLLARLYGTNNVNNCSYYCHQASGVGLNNSLGTGTATVTLEDLEHADLVFVIGGNPASNHPRLMSSLKNLRRRGGQVVVINPVRETGMVKFRVPSDPWSLLWGTRIATHYIQPHIGGDLALLIGIAKRIVELGADDRSYLDTCCDNTAAWRSSLDETDWSAIERQSGVTRDQIDAVARCYASARNVIFSWTMGITHHVHGVENVHAIVNLALARGMVGRPHAGLMPIRGHSNVQGIGSVGVTPQLKQAIFQGLVQQYSLQLPSSPGLDTMACMEAADQQQLDVGICLGGNLYGSNPDALFASRALSRLSLVAYLSTTLNTGHAWGLGRRTLILPVLARDEEPQPTTQESMFNYVRYSDGGPARHSGPRAEVELVAELGERLVGQVGGVDWAELRQHRSIREMIGRVVPGWEQLTEIDANRREFQIPGRTFHQPRFPTPTGRAQLMPLNLPEPVAATSLAADQLRLMTVRSEGQFNTVVYETEDVYRGQERRDVILIHPDDLQRLGVQPDEAVRVTSSIGSMEPVLARSYPDIRPGNALMYYPEANLLVPRHVDPQSRTPAFKNIPITISRLNAAARPPTSSSTSSATR